MYLFPDVKKMISASRKGFRFANIVNHVIINLQYFITEDTVCFVSKLTTVQSFTFL